MTEAADIVSTPERGRLRATLWIAVLAAFIVAVCWAAWPVRSATPWWLFSGIYFGGAALTALAGKPWGSLRRGWGLSEVLASDKVVDRPRALGAVELLKTLGYMTFVALCLPPLLAMQEYPRAAVMAVATSLTIVSALKELHSILFGRPISQVQA